MKTNATYLFQEPCRSFHNSESWWSAFFSLFVLYQAAHAPQSALRVCTYHDGRFAWSGELQIAGIQFVNLVVEGRLSAEPFRLSLWPSEYLALKPDISILRRDSRSVTFIEIKTIGASITGNILLYREMVEHLRKEGWSADIYYLVSHGHENNDWKLISDYEIPLVLWEHVLQRAADTPLGRALGMDLTPYTTLPPELQPPATQTEQKPV